MNQEVVQNRGRQFKLIGLFRYVTICGVLAGLSGYLGVGTSLCLMGFALALGAGQGVLGLVALVGASLAADIREIVPGDQALGRQLALMLTAAALCASYRLSAGDSQ